MHTEIDNQRDVHEGDIECTVDRIEQDKECNLANRRIISAPIRKTLHKPTHKNFHPSFVTESIQNQHTTPIVQRRFV